MRKFKKSRTGGADRGRESQGSRGHSRPDRGILAKGHQAKDSPATDRPATDRPPKNPQAKNPQARDRQAKVRQDPGRRDQARPQAAHAPTPPGGDKHWLYGTHAVLAAWNNPRRACFRLMATTESSSRLPKGVANRPGPEIVERQDIERMLPAGAVHQSLALLVGPLPETAIEDLCREAENLEKATIVVLDQAVDPQNIGAILRSAAAFGALAVILPSRHSPSATPALAKAASGALEAVPLVQVTNLARALDLLKKAGFWCIGFDMDAPITLAEADLGGKAALVLGAEGEGLRRLTRETCDLLVRIPLSDAMESLNLSVTAAIALYETKRAS
jgi:23S rRNA (guanosine2251-2'-O)-methyltransferase